MFSESRYLNNFLWDFNKHEKPYPFITIDNFLKIEIYEEIKKKFPSLETFRSNGDIESNNEQIRIAFSSFNKFSEKWMILERFWNFFLRDEFFYNFCEFYENDIKNLYPNLHKQ